MTKQNNNIVMEFAAACQTLVFLVHLRVAMLRAMLAYAHLEEARRLLEGE